MLDSFTFRNHLCITFELLYINLYEVHLPGALQLDEAVVAMASHGRFVVCCSTSGASYFAAWQSALFAG